MEAPLHVWARPLESMSEYELAEFEGLGDAGGFAAWPKVGSRLTTRIATGLDMDGDWVVVQAGTYRYAVDDAEGLRGGGLEEHTSALQSLMRISYDGFSL